MHTLVYRILPVIILLAVLALPIPAVAGDTGTTPPSASPPDTLCPAGYTEVAVKDTGDDLDVYTFDTDPWHPIDIYFSVPSSFAGSPGYIIVRYYDVDLPDEIDEVFLNNVYLGYFTVSSDDAFAEEMFAIPSGVVVAGTNHVMIQVDEGTPNPDPSVSPTYDEWGVSVDSIRVCLRSSGPFVGGSAIAYGDSYGSAQIGYFMVATGLIMLSIGLAGLMWKRARSL